MKISKKLTAIVLCFLLLLPFAVACGAALTFESAALPDGTVGVAYSQQLKAGGAEEITYALSEGSALPAGLTLTPDGKIAGIPAAKAEGAKFTVTAAAAGAENVSAEFTLSIGQGALAYAGGEISAVVGEESAATVATATGAGGAVTYTLKAGVLPAGLTLQPNGVITGVPAAAGEETEFTVTASSQDCAPADANFKMKITLPRLTLAAATLPNGSVGTFYGEQLPAAGGTENAVAYALAEGSVLPAGLTLGASGYLSGVPTERVTRHKFTVVASAQGYESAAAEITVTIMAATDVEFAGKIKYTAKELPTAYVGEKYVASGGVKNATADNFAPVVYALAADSVLPAGFTVYANGDLRCEDGPTAVGTYKFKVTASAAKCEAVSVEFTLKVEPAKLIFVSKTLGTATVGETYATSVATASTPDGKSAVVKYREKTEGSLPAGLSLSEDGQVTGTPVKSAKQAMFTVTVSAPGYTERDAYFYIHIRDAVTEVRDGVFEAEYIDLTGMKGEGWSGSSDEERMIQNAAPNASNGYYLGWTLSENTFTFAFTSSAAVSGATLKMRLATEVGKKTIDPASFEVRVNGAAIPYAAVTLYGENGKMGAFEDFVVTSALQLAAGANTVQLIIKDNSLLDGRIFGPGIDCVKIANYGSAVLSWRPCAYNLDWLR